MQALAADSPVSGFLSRAAAEPRCSAVSPGRPAAEPGPTGNWWISQPCSCTWTARPGQLPETQRRKESGVVLEPQIKKMIFLRLRRTSVDDSWFKVGLIVPSSPAQQLNNSSEWRDTNDRREGQRSITTPLRPNIPDHNRSVRTNETFQVEAERSRTSHTLGCQWRAPWPGWLTTVFLFNSLII